MERGENGWMDGGGMKGGRYEVTTVTFCEGHSMVISHFEGVCGLDS